VEVFINDGTTVLTGRSFGDPLADRVTLFAENGDVTFSNLEIYALQSIWSEDARNSAQNLNLCD
jgi:sucrose-6-phosphate hydrolase SacC (GH32 family)